MCYLNWRPEYWEFSPPSPGPRSMPRLDWAVPVDIVSLGASLEAFSNQLQQNTTLRLCHRFGDGPLSMLPQEILDQVIGEAHKVERDTLWSKWESNFMCYQDRCSRFHHLSPSMIAPSILAGEYGSEEQIEDLYDSENELETVLEMSWEVHLERQEAWVDQVCLCREPSDATKKESSFFRLNEILRRCFGLEAIALHEVLSDNLVKFLPDSAGFGECSYYTSCFLTTAAGAHDAPPESTRTAPHQNKVYMKADNHLAYHRTINPSKLDITKEQRLSFARVMRLLDLQPHFQLSELDTILASETKEEAFWAICDVQVPGCPAPTTETRLSKKKLLLEYIKAKSHELSQTQWPQLMMISASDAVGPIVASRG